MSIPFDPILAASHSFIERLFESLNYEYRNTNIRFQCIKTLVSCNNNDENDLSLMNLAINSMKHINGNSNKVICIGDYYANGLKVF
jgi:hypothetical protein